MLTRISAPLLVGTVLALFVALGFGIYAFSANEDESADAPAPSATARIVAGTAPPARPARAPAAAAPASPNETVALAPRATAVLNQRHWSSDADFAYAGHWEHVERLYDGRSGGSSSRTFRPGSRAILAFYGRFVRLYGVVGPGGGPATVDVDGRGKQVVNFYSKSKSVHQVVYSSPMLEAGPHHLTLSIEDGPDVAGSHRRYVNINGAEYGL